MQDFGESLSCSSFDPTQVTDCTILNEDLASEKSLCPLLPVLQELPVGVLTAVLGGGYLFWLMYRGRTKGAF